MHLLKRMGWREGQGLGKNSDGIVEPIAPRLKFDTKGLKSEEEVKPKKVAGSLQLFDPQNIPKTHPVAMLQEFCQKQHQPPPDYVMVEQDGPAHKPTFLMKVNVNNVWYKVTCV